MGELNTKKLERIMKKLGGENIATSNNLESTFLDKIEELADGGSAIGGGTGSTGSGGTTVSKKSFNIYLSETEPEAKEGVWIETPKTYTGVKFYKNDNFYGIGEVTDITIPYGYSSGQSAVRVGDYLYFFGSNVGTYSYKVYKYNLKTKQFTEIENTLNKPFARSSVVAHGTDIYINGANAKDHYWLFCKFDTITDTFTDLGDTNFPSALGSTVVVGDYLYAFGGSYDVKYRYQAYKYSIKDGTWTQLTNIATQFFAGQAVANGTDIYLFYGTDAYKFDTLTETYTTLANIPYTYKDAGAIYANGGIYLMGCSTAEAINDIYRYDIASNTYTKVNELIQDFRLGTVIEYEGVFYLFGGHTTLTSVVKLDLSSPLFADNTILISQQSNTYKATLFKNVENLNIEFSRIGFYDVETMQILDSLPTYYGDGTTWTKIN